MWWRSGAGVRGYGFFFFFFWPRWVFTAVPEPSLAAESGGSSLVEMRGPLIVGASLGAGHSSRVQGSGVGTHA